MNFPYKDDVSYARALGAAAAAFYFLRIAASPSSGHFIDYVNVIFHEAGHLLLMPFGEFLSIAGGSLLQLLLPALCAGYFIRRREYFSASIVLFWLGENFGHISVYAADAVALQLPLLGGEGSIHDWNYLLSSFGALEHTAAVAGFLRAIGLLITVAAIVGSFYFSFATRPVPLMETLKLRK